MKYKNKLSLIGIALTTLFFAGACSSILDEEQRGNYTPDFFQTQEGVEHGVTSLYGHLRLIYGAYYYAFTQNGTDETTYGQSADNNFKDADLTEGGGGNLTATSDRADVFWDNAFPNINTANGIIENGEAVGISPSLIAEANFFRAFDYFMLVQTFGGVPLDLGAGDLKFNSYPSRTSVRNTVPEVYTKCIFPDLKKAVDNLPDAGRVVGGVTNTLARLYLAKAYLTYGWWLENPNNIPTYPDTPRTDPDGHDAAWYFQEAYNMSVEGKARIVTTSRLAEMKKNGEKIAMLTAYDYSTARIMDQAGVDVILVGDSAANVMAGFDSTLPITLDQMIYHAQSVVRAVQRALVVVDLPFGTYQGNSKEALASAIRIMKETEASAVKLEGGAEILESVQRILSAGIPVMGHLGLTPQSINKFGTYGVRAKDKAEATKLMNDALLLEQAGCFSVVLEKIPASLGYEVSAALEIPTISIGAGAGCDGQVLVVHDMLGVTNEFSPRFLRRYADLYSVMTQAFTGYVDDVKKGAFPSPEEQY